LHGHRHFDGRLVVVRTRFRKASGDHVRIADSLDLFEIAFGLTTGIGAREK
jgi:hypothetical protein